MCGICGQYNFGDRAPVARRDVEAMTRTIVHRGPDDEGYLVSGPLGLGFRRCIQHKADTSAVEEPQAGWGLEKKSHSEGIAVKGNGTVDIADRDGDLPDLRQSKSGRPRVGHERFPAVADAERSAKLPGPACKDFEARQTRMAAPVSFSCLFGLIYLECPFFPLFPFCAY